MKRYIGTKIIHAEPADRAGTPGYFVQYADGYTSWSPKAVFEEVYEEAGAMTFGMALDALKIGKRIARNGWNDKGMFVYLVSAFDRPAVSGVEQAFFGGYSDVPQHAQMNIKNVDGTVCSWVPSQSDCLSDDWMVLD